MSFFSLSPDRRSARGLPPGDCLYLSPNLLPGNVPTVLGGRRAGQGG